jgi:hypothetical protein
LANDVYDHIEAITPTLLRPIPKRVKNGLRWEGYFAVLNAKKRTKWRSL